MRRPYSFALLLVAVLLANVERASSFDLTSDEYPPGIRSFASNQNNFAPMRLLRRSDNNEERAIGGTMIAELAFKLKGGASKLTDKMVNLKKYEDDAARAMKLLDIDDSLTSKNINNLVQQVIKFNSKSFIKVSLIGTLTAKYGDGAVAAALINAERSATSPSIAAQFRKLRVEQLKRWKNNGESTSAVSTLLRFHLGRDLGQVLIKYAALVKESDRALLKALIKGVGGEEKLGDVLYAARQDSAMIEKITKLENTLIRKWTREGQLPANIHQRLGFYENVDDAFTADNLNRFMKYVDDFNVNDPNNEKPVIELYTNAFGNVAVASKLESALKDPSTRTAAEKLQVQLWIKNQASFDDVLATLKIDIKERAEIVNQKVDLLEQLVAVKGADSMLIEKLTATVGGNRVLATILERAKATTLQKKQFAVWMNNGVTPENFLTVIYKKKAYAATKEQKEIAAKFTTYYNVLRSSN